MKILSANPPWRPTPGQRSYACFTAGGPAWLGSSFGSEMKAFAALVSTALVAGLVWAVVSFSPLFLSSRIERLDEKGLPKVMVEKGGIIYCRMRADDFRFPLPPGSHALVPIITS